MPDLLLPSNPSLNYRANKDAIDAAVHRVLDSGWYILGNEVEAFEQEFAAYVGAGEALGVASGTDALQLALRACEIGPGDEVITVSHTAVATVAAVELCGATPVLADIDLATFTLAVDQLEGAITDRTKAILPVHLYGHPADLETVRAIADKHGLRVVEDCAQSHGARYRGRSTGAWGDIGTFSFYPTKNLGALGDGGAVVTSDPELAERARLLREYGWRQRYVSDFPGMNSRLDEMQAAILRAKLSVLECETERRRSIARQYDELLRDTCLVLPSSSANVSHVYHQYVVRTPKRDGLRQWLHEHGIGSLIHYPVPVHRQPAYRDRLRCVGALPNTDAAVAEILSLPIYPELSDAQVRQVAEAVLAWCQQSEA